MDFRPPKTAQEASLGRLVILLERFKAVLGPSWEPLGRSVGPLKPTWGPRGGLLGCHGAILEASWALLGRCWGPLGPSWAVRELKRRKCQHPSKTKGQSMILALSVDLAKGQSMQPSLLPGVPTVELHARRPAGDHPGTRSVAGPGGCPSATARSARCGSRR